MALRAEEQKREQIDGVLGRVTQKFAGARAAPIQRFVNQFYDHVPPEDVVPRGADDLYGAALSLWQFAQERMPGTAKLRAFNPRLDAEGWRAGRTVVEIVNDDMPFLVDSVTAALNRLGLIVHLVIHPILLVRRDTKGKLADLLEPGAGGNGSEAIRESAMHVEVSEQSDPARLAEITAKLTRVLEDVRFAITDWQRMRGALLAARQAVLAAPAAMLNIPAADVSETADFLAWLDDDNYTFLGYREYRFGTAETGTGIDIVPESGLGILRRDTYTIFDGLRNFKTLPPAVQEFLRLPSLLLIAKTNKRSTIHRPAHMDAIGVRMFGPDGSAVGERLFVGLFTSLAYSRGARSIPLLRRKVSRVLSRAGFPPQSHDAKALQHILDTFPRDELFQISEDELYETALGVLNLQERQRIALFVRHDPFGRFVSCFVYVPRERYTTELRRRFGEILERSFKGEVSNVYTQIDDSVLARVHYVVRTDPHQGRENRTLDVAVVERELAEAGRSWEDRLSEVLTEAQGEAAGLALLKRYGRAFPTAYKERFAAAVALYDIERIEEVRAGKTPLALTLYKPIEAEATELRFKIYRRGAPAALSDVLPMLEQLDLKVISEEPYRIQPAGDGEPMVMQDFELTCRTGAVDVARDRGRFEAAFARLWAGEMESDGFNRLILGAGLDWRQVTVLRLYAKALRQAGSAFSQAYMEDTLVHYPLIAAKLARLFERRFDPAGNSAASDSETLAHDIEQDLDAVANLDDDRILRSFLTLIRKSLRTNYFQRTADGAPKPYLSVKLASHEIELLPLPRPLYEIYVYGPAHGGLPSPRRQGGARRHPLVRPQGGFPHRDPGPDEGADGEERRHRARGLQGRLRGEASADRLRPRRPRGADGGSGGVLQDPDARPSRHHRQHRRRHDRAAGGRRPPRRGRSLSRGRRRQGHRHFLRHRQRRGR